MRKIFTFFVALLCAGTMFAGNGALKGAFTINAEGDIIQFSQGNLQYVASSNTWQFATNQYDVIGNAVGNTTAEEDRATQSDPIDLFGWGTGSNPTTVSNNDADYTTFTDWGTNPISNGGNKANAWRTLSRDEWYYLFHERPNADNLFGFGKVLGKEGVIILPDDWQLPAGATFNPSTSNGLTFNGTDTYTNAGNNNYTHNTYASAEAWAKMEAAGAVFLPAAGFRSGTTVDNLTDGNYWSSTEYDGDDQFTHELYFTTKYCAPQSYDHRRKGYAVRLVRTFKPDAGDQAIIDGVKYQFVMKPGELVVFVPAQPWTEETLTIPDSVEYYGKKYEVYYIYSNAFQGNTNIKTVNLSPYKIWANAFENCTNLTTVNLNEGVDEINQFAFNNIGATSLHLPKSARLLDNTSGSPFSNNKFTEITVEEGNPYLMVGEDGALYTNPANHWRYALVAFPYASSKPFAEVPEGVSIVLENAFSGCLNMADTIILPESLKTANYSFEFTKVKCAIINSKQLSGTSNRIFWFADELEEVIFGKSVEKLSNMMFYGCDAINKITIQGEIMPDWNATHTSGSCPFDDDVITNAKLYVNCGWGESYKADDNKWGEFTPTNIIDTLMYDVQIVADKGTAWISSIVDCNTRRVSISGIPSGYTFVKWNNGETTTTATYTITSDTVIRAYVKKNLLISDTFKSETVEGVPVTYKILKKSKDNGEFTVQVGVDDYYTQAISKDYAGTLTIPDSAVYYDEKYAVVRVGHYAFLRCNVTNVILPDGITEIGNDAFGYTKITSMEMPNSVTTLGSEAFYECRDLASLTLSSNLTEIPQRGFSYSSITEINIPASVEYLYERAFAGCTNLATVTWHPENLKQIGSRPFQNTPWFEAYPAEENGAKYAGDKLLGGSNDDITSLTIKEGTKMIATNAAELFRNITDIYVPSSVESIGWGAFYDAKLERCTLNIVTPPTLFSGSNKVWDNGVKAKELFNPTYYYKVLVYVPKEAVNTYKEHAKWTEMADNIRPIGGWTVEFKDHNGNNIIDPQQVEQGERPAVIPTEVDTYYTNDYMYVFANDWDTAIVNIGDTIYSAKYIQNELPEYKVHWLTAEGGEEISWTRFQHGHSAEAKGAEKAAELDVPACMQFDTWSADLSSITEEIFVYPIWKDAAYTVIFKDGLTDEIIITKYNRECHEDVDAPAAPEHAGYTFIGWDSDAYKNVTSDLTITALYEESVATGMGNMEDSEIRIQKVIRDGQLLIIRDEKVYNVMGELVN